MPDAYTVRTRGQRSSGGVAPGVSGTGAEIQSASGDGLRTDLSELCMKAAHAAY